jgi:hypothetical protein
MEFADFVHINPDENCVTLIHVKGSNNDKADREVSVSSYEVVVGQAIKNIQHLDRMTLADVLRKGAHKRIAGAVWHNGEKQADRAGIIAIAEMLRADYKRIVVVLPPQLTEAEKEACVSDVPTATRARIMRMKQLDTLMLAAELSARAVGATLIGFGAASPVVT